MASDTRNVKLGVCSITFDGVDLGYTKGGVEVTVSTETKEVSVDQFGQTPIDERIMARKVTAKTPLAETTIENMAKIMPGSTLTIAGTAATGTITLSTAVPAAGDSVTIGGEAFIFRVSVSATNDVLIGANINETASNLAAALNARSTKVLASAALGVVTLTAAENGVGGNAITLAKTAVTAANITTSGATLTGGTGTSSKKLQVKTGVGTSLLSLAKQMVFHPIDLPASDKSADFVIPLAMTPGNFTYAYKYDEERVFSTEFKGYPDPATGTLFYVGDTTI